MATGVGDREGAAPRLPPALPYGREIQRGDPEWTGSLPCLGDVVEVSLQGSSLNFDDEAWVAMRITGASRQGMDQAGTVLQGTFLGCESELKHAEVLQIIKEGAIHMCGAGPCPESIPGAVLHVSKARFWTLGQFDCSYLSREGKAVLTKARKKEAAPPNVPGGKKEKWQSPHLAERRQERFQKEGDMLRGFPRLRLWRSLQRMEAWKVATRSRRTRTHVALLRAAFERC